MADGRKSRIPQPRSFLENDGVKAALLVAAICFIYAGTLSGGFIWDDVTYIVGNKLLQGPDALVKIWTDRALPDFWPVSFSLFWLEYRIFGLNVTGYHVICVMLHGINVLLLWRILGRMGCRYACAAALLFAVHPVNVESVAWIFQAKTTLSSALALAALLLYLEDGHPSPRGRYLGAIFMFLLAMAAKASVATWPLAMLLCARLSGGEELWARGGRQLKRIAPFLVVAALLGAINLWWYSGHGPEAASELIRDDTLFSRLSIAGMSLWFYLGKAFCPLDLAFVYPRWRIDPFGPWAILPLIFALLAALVVVWRRKSPPLGAPLFYGLGFYLVTLLPVLGIFEIYFMRYSFVADHWQYMSLMGLMALSAEVMGRALQARGAAAWILAALVVALFSGLSLRQTAIYQDEETIWRDTLAKNPDSWMVHNSIGLVLKKKGIFDEAMVHYQKAASLYPQGQSYYNMAMILEKQGQLQEAYELYVKAAALNPYFSIIFTNMGIVQAKLGMQEAARASLERALELAPTAENHYNIGYFVEGSGELALALFHFAEAMRLDPNNELFRSSWQRVQTSMAKANGSVP